MEHVLKVDPLPLDLTVHGFKGFEIRKDDRGYAVGDVLDLRQTRHSAADMAGGKPLEYTGRFARCLVTHLLRGPAYGIPEGYVVMSTRVFATCTHETPAPDPRSGCVAVSVSPAADGADFTVGHQVRP